jgi:hypothetical protein
LGNLKGSAGIWLPKLTKVYAIHLMGLDTENCKSTMLMLAVGKALGIGTLIYGKNTFFHFKADRSQIQHRVTGDAAVDRDAMRKRAGPTYRSRIKLKTALNFESRVN